MEWFVIPSKQHRAIVDLPDAGIELIYRRVIGVFMFKKILLVGMLVLSLSGQTRADLIAFWNFGTSAGVGTPSQTGADADVGISAFSVGNPVSGASSTILSSTSPSTSPFSGQFNLGTSVKAGAFNTGVGGSTYFEFTVTNANPLKTLTLNNFDFASRSTSTGAQTFSLRSSADGFASDIVTVSAPNTSAWAARNTSPSFAFSAPATTFRLFGSGVAGSPGPSFNTRIDDLTASFAITAVPEPTSMVLVGLMGAAGVAVRAGRRFAKKA